MLPSFLVSVNESRRHFESKSTLPAVFQSVHRDSESGSGRYNDRSTVETDSVLSGVTDRTGVKAYMQEKRRMRENIHDDNAGSGLASSGNAGKQHPPLLDLPSIHITSLFDESGGGDGGLSADAGAEDDCTADDTRSVGDFSVDFVGVSRRDRVAQAIRESASRRPRLGLGGPRTRMKWTLAESMRLKALVDEHGSGSEWSQHPDARAATLSDLLVCIVCTMHMLCVLVVRVGGALVVCLRSLLSPSQTGRRSPSSVPTSSFVQTVRKRICAYDGEPCRSRRSSGRR